MNDSYAQFKVVRVEILEDGTRKPVCVCPVCGQSQLVQPQKLIKLLWLVDCTNEECKNHKHTASIPESEL